MQVHGGPQLDLSAQVAMVRAKTRPWKSIIALVLAIGAAITSGWAHSHFKNFFGTDNVVNQVIAAASAAAFFVFASIATTDLCSSRWPGRPTRRSSGTRSSSSVRSPR
jgi:hypothetical protein